MELFDSDQVVCKTKKYIYQKWCSPFKSRPYHKNIHLLTIDQNEWFRYCMKYCWIFYFFNYWENLMIHHCNENTCFILKVKFLLSSSWGKLNTCSSYYYKLEFCGRITPALNSSQSAAENKKYPTITPIFQLLSTLVTKKGSGSA